MSPYLVFPHRGWRIMLCYCYIMLSGIKKNQLLHKVSEIFLNFEGVWIKWVNPSPLTQMPGDWRVTPQANQPNHPFLWLRSKLIAVSAKRYFRLLPRQSWPEKVSNHWLKYLFKLRFFFYFEWNRMWKPLDSNKITGCWKSLVSCEAAQLNHKSNMCVANLFRK